MSHPSEDVTLERVVRILQGPLAPIACATRGEPEPCTLADVCGLQETWAEVRDATIAILERTTLASLAERSSGPVGHAGHDRTKAGLTRSESGSTPLRARR